MCTPPPPLPRFTIGMLREAERQLKSSLMDQDMVVTYLELVKVLVCGHERDPESLEIRSPCSPL